VNVHIVREDEQALVSLVDQRDKLSVDLVRILVVLRVTPLLGHERAIRSAVVEIIQEGAKRLPIAGDKLVEVVCCRPVNTVFSEVG